LVIHALSAVDMALWDIIGKALNMPIWALLGGETKPRIPAYCTGNDIEQHIAFGFKRLKLAVPYGPADGREGLNKNLELVKRTRDSWEPTVTSCWTAGWRSPRNMPSNSQRGWRLTASTGWRSACSPMIMRASVGCAERSNPP